MHRLLRTCSAFLLRLFFRRIEVVGEERVPATGPVVFVLNHPNALIDPLLLLAHAPRRVVFLAKEPLFRMPVIGSVVRALGSIPVHRRSDGADPARNREMFATVRRMLDGGGAIALFPEGTSHSDASMRPFRTGAARIALGAAAAGGDITVVPAGLFYTSKGTFRSSVLLFFGHPVRASAGEAAADAAGEPDAGRVREFTAMLRDAIGELTLQAGHHDAVGIAARAELVLTSGDDDDGGRLPLADQLAIRQQLVDGYTLLKETQPRRLERLQARLDRLEGRLRQAGLDAETFNYGPVDRKRALAYAARTISSAMLVLPVALLGIVGNVVPYRLTGPLAVSASQESADLLATVKVLVAAVVYPLAWAATGWLASQWLGTEGGIAVALAMPAAGFVGLRFLERLDRFIGETRGALLAIFRPAAYNDLVAERAALRAEIIALGEDA